MAPRRTGRGPAAAALVACLLVVAAPAVAGLAATTGVAGATPPPPPAAYYGSLTVNGEPAPAGVAVTARIDGDVRGRLTTGQDGAYGGPGAFDEKLKVEGTDGDDGKPVRFFVGGVEADTTVVWHSADVRRVDLAVTGNVTLPDESDDNGDGESGGGGGGGGGGQQTDDGDGADVFVQSAENGSASVRVDGATAGQPVEVDVPGGDDENVSVDGLTVTTSRDTDISLEISASEDPPAGAPPLDTGDDAVGYLQVDHDVPESAVSEVTFTFRVSRDRLAERGVTPGDVVLYRRHDGAWQTLETVPAGETATHYVFEATSPGLSVFAIGVREDDQGDGAGDDARDARADLAVTDAGLSAGEVAAGEDVTVTATVENRGDADGEATVSLVVDGVTVGEKSVAVPAGASRQVTFTYRTDEPGEYEVQVGDETAGSLVVIAADAGTTAAGTDRDGENGGDGGPPGASLLVALVVVLVVAVLVVAAYLRRS